MNIAVTGSTGLIGSALVARLRAAGHSISRLVRPGHTPAAGEKLIHWDPERGAIDAEALEGHDAVVHLAGESIAGLWTRSKRARIMESRKRGTTLLARTLAGLQHRPSVLISASAIGFYGDRPPEDKLDERAPRGTGFLADVVTEWEAASRLAEAGAIRVVNTRFGLVLSEHGGALQPMLLPFRLGLGATLGSGRQVWSWIALDDVTGAIIHALNTTALNGPVNVVSPNPVTNREFTDTLADVLNRPTVLRVPGFVLKAVAGEMADEMLLAGSNVVPRKLQETGYSFEQPNLEPALRAILR